MLVQRTLRWEKKKPWTLLRISYSFISPIYLPRYAMTRTYTSPGMGSSPWGVIVRITNEFVGCELL